MVVASEEDPGDAIAPPGAYQHFRAAEVETAAAATMIAAAVAVAKGESAFVAAPGLLQSTGRGLAWAHLVREGVVHGQRIPKSTISGALSRYEHARALFLLP